MQKKRKIQDVENKIMHYLDPQKNKYGNRF